MLLLLRQREAAGTRVCGHVINSDLWEFQGGAELADGSHRRNNSLAAAIKICFTKSQPVDSFFHFIPLAHHIPGAFTVKLMQTFVATPLFTTLVFAVASGLQAQTISPLETSDSTQAIGTVITQPGSAQSWVTQTSGTKTIEDKSDKKDRSSGSESEPLHEGANEFAAFVGGGNGFGKRSSTDFFYAGGRWGKVLTDDRLSGWLRGNFEFALEVMPFYSVFQEGENAFGAGFTPVILTWNFLGTKKVKPFADIGGGLLFTNHDVPTNTNNLNFTPQGGFGIHYLTTPHRAITGEIKYLHVSNASLANQNSGINASIQFTIGYTWFK